MCVCVSVSRSRELSVSLVSCHGRHVYIFISAPPPLFKCPPLLDLCMDCLHGSPLTVTLTTVSISSVSHQARRLSTLCALWFGSVTAKVTDRPVEFSDPVQHDRNENHGFSCCYLHTLCLSLCRTLVFINVVSVLSHTSSLVFIIFSRMILLLVQVLTRGLMIGY